MDKPSPPIAPTPKGRFAAALLGRAAPSIPGTQQEPVLHPVDGRVLYILHQSQRDFSRVGNKKKKILLQAKAPCTDLLLRSAKGTGEKAWDKCTGIGESGEGSTAHANMFGAERHHAIKAGLLDLFLITHSYIINYFGGLHNAKTLQRPLA